MKAIPFFPHSPCLISTTSIPTRLEAPQKEGEADFSRTVFPSPVSSLTYVRRPRKHDNRRQWAVGNKR